MGFHSKVRYAFQTAKHLFLGQRIEIESVIVKGEAAFCKAIGEALLLLREKDVLCFGLINSHISLIIQSEETLLKPYRRGAILAFAEQEAASVTQTWLASLLVYEAYRTRLYQEFVRPRFSFTKVPANVYSGDKAWNFMRRCLMKIGAGDDEIEHLNEFVAHQKNVGADSTDTC